MKIFLLVFIIVVIRIDLSYSQSQIEKLISSRIDAVKKMPVIDTTLRYKIIEEAISLAKMHKKDSLLCTARMYKIDLDFWYDKSNYIEALKEIDEIIRLSKNVQSFNYRSAKAQKVNFLVQLGRLGTAEICYKEFEKEVRVSDHFQQLVIALFYLGRGYLDDDNYESGISSLNKVISWSLEYNLQQTLFVAANNLAHIYADIDMAYDALRCDSIALANCSKEDVRYSTLAFTYANHLIAIEDYQKSIDNLKDILKKPQSDKKMADINCLLLENYTHLRNKVKAEEYFVKCQKCIEKLPEADVANGLYAQLGLYYNLMGNSQLARDFFLKAINHAKKTSKNYRVLESVYEYYFEASAETVPEYLIKEYLTIKDSASILRKENIAIQNKIKYKSFEKDKENLELSNKVYKNRIEKLNLNNHLDMLNFNNEILLKEKIIQKNKIDFLEIEKDLSNFKNERNDIILKEAARENVRKNKVVKYTISILGVFGLLILVLLYQKNKLTKLANEINIKHSKIQLLNRELNHRVKNNLAFMTSLLEMQSRRTGNTETRQLLRESETRLKTLALVHANLSKNELDTEINLSSYLAELISHLESIFSIPNKQLDMDIQLTDYILNAEDAMRLGLIVNELITNSIKHAFDEVENPVITIQTSVNDDGKLVLNYKDNGSGIKTTQAALSGGSLGTKLTSLLKEQLGDRYVVVA